MNGPVMIGESWHEHFTRQRIEREFRDWCRDHGKDPEDVGSALDYEDYYKECVLPNL